MLFDKSGQQVPPNMVIGVGEIFKKILKEVSSCDLFLSKQFIYVALLATYWQWLFSIVQTDNVRKQHMDDMSISQGISIVLDKHPELR